MTHTDTDIAEILERFRKEFFYFHNKFLHPDVGIELENLEDFITRECLALKKKWEREKANNE